MWTLKKSDERKKEREKALTDIYIHPPKDGTGHGGLWWTGGGAGGHRQSSMDPPAIITQRLTKRAKHEFHRKCRRDRDTF